MRILYLTQVYLPHLGGLEVLCSQLLGELGDRGHEVAVVTTVDDPAVPRGVCQVDGVPVLRLDAGQFVLDATSLLTAQRQLGAFVEDFAPDVVHAHDGGALLWFYERRARRRWPLVVTLHIVQTRHIPDRLASLARVLAEADWVTGVSDDVVRDALTFAPELQGRISTVLNGVAPPGPASPVPDGAAELLCLGRLSPQKGFDQALDALAQVVARGREVHLTIAGSGPSEDELAAQIIRLGLGQHATLVGRVEHHRIHELLAAATAVVMPSRFEGLPLVALEAAWMARPVIATDAAGLRCVVEDGVSGIVVAEDDIDALAQAMVRLIDDRAEARRLGADARDLVARHWSIGRCAAEYESLYRRLVAEHSPPATRR